MPVRHQRNRSRRGLKKQCLVTRWFGNRGRLFDLIVVGRPVSGAATPSRSRLESAIFESGRLTLIAPPTPPTGFGETIVIAWNSSTETARTVALAMPFLEQAKRVVILSIEGYGVPGPDGTDLRQSLSRNGIAAQASIVPKKQSHSCSRHL